MKKTYIKPETKVVLMKARTQLLAGSGGVGDTGVRMKWSGDSDSDAYDSDEGL